MKRFKKIVITFILALSLTTVAPEVTTNQINIPTVVHVQAKTKYVYVTRTGKKYHIRKCGNGTYTKTTLQKAKARGLTPCKKCFG
jgi:hypothetical protein